MMCRQRKLTSMTKFEPTFSESPGVPFTQFGNVLGIVETLNLMGVPTDEYVENAGIPLAYLEQPNESIPLILAGRFLDMVVYNEGIEDLGVMMGLQINALQDRGSYSARLRTLPTCLTYLEQGCRNIGQLTTGVELWMLRDGKGASWNMLHPGLPEGWGIQPALFLLAATLNTLKVISGNGWQPKSIRLPHSMNVGRAVDEALQGIPIAYCQGPISIHVESALLAKTLFSPAPPIIDAGFDKPLPASFSTSIESAIWMLLEDGRCDLRNVSEVVGLHSRTLQRRLQSEGCSFGGMLNAQRHRMAVSLLEHRDLSVTEIAFQLGYSETSNFTRTFRKTAGCPPSAYRI